MRAGGSSSAVTWPPAAEFGLGRKPLAAIAAISQKLYAAVTAPSTMTARVISA
jgi:hypothetical protein